MPLKLFITLCEFYNEVYMTMFKNIKRSKLPGAYFQSDHGLLRSAFSKGKNSYALQGL